MDQMKKPNRLKEIFMMGTPFVAVPIGIAFFPIAMAVASKDLVYLYIGIGAWALLGYGLRQAYKMYKLNEQLRKLCDPISSTPSNN